MTDTLYGYIGDLYGNEKQVLLMQPVVYDGENYYRDTGREHVPVRKYELEFVRVAPDGLVDDWEPGNVILFVGSKLNGVLGRVIIGDRNSYVTPSGGRVAAVEVVYDNEEE